MSHRYFPHTADDVKAMLDVCGVPNINALYADVPDSLRLKSDYNLPEGMSELELRAFFERISAANEPLTCFAGAGAYDHYTPAVIPSIVARSEFLTAYTPYQPEISQGTLQYIFEYQTMMSQLTAMEVCNASMYDGATATAEAMLMAVHASKKRRRILVSATLNPSTAAVLNTYSHYHDVPVQVIPERDGVVDLTALKELLQSGDVAAVILQTPNYYGILEDYTGFADLIHQAKALMIINSPALPLAVIRPAGEWGADIAVGEAQSLGIPLNYGGPYLGYICTAKNLMRKLPGRIVGATVDDKGQRVFVLTLQAREQHIRREKATSNICSNQGLMTLHAAAYISLMGTEGLKEVNRISCDAAHYLADCLQATGKVRLTYPNQPYLNEFSVDIVDPLDTAGVLGALSANGILGGVAVDSSQMIVAVTEKRTKEEIDKYVSIIKNL